MAVSEQLAIDFAPDVSPQNPSMDELPDGWRVARLDQVCEINPSRKGRTKYPDDLPVTFVSMSAVDEGAGTIAAPDVRPFSEVKKGYTWFVENDVLFAKISPCMQNGKAAVARGLSNGVGFGSTEFHVLRPGPDVLPEWVHLFIRQPSFRAAAARHFTGSVGQQRVPDSVVGAQVIPVPPLPEQRRIVTRIEELSAKIERARGLRREAAEETTAAAERAKADSIDALEWDELPLSDLLREKPQNGLSKRPSDSPPGMPILRISAATSRNDAIIDERDYKYLDLDQRDVLSYKVEPGDLLACRFNGNLRFAGKFALYQGYLNESCVYPDKLIRFRVNTNKAQPEYVRFAMNSPRRRTVIESFCATIAGNIGISAGNLKTVAIPVPPIAEQKRIVIYLDQVQAKVDALKRLQAESAIELDALLPVVLARAFRGES